MLQFYLKYIMPKAGTNTTRRDETDCLHNLYKSFWEQTATKANYGAVKRFLRIRELRRPPISS